MKRILAVLAFAGLAVFPAEAAVQYANSADNASMNAASGDAILIVLVRDASGKKMFASARENVAATALGLLAATGAQTQSLGFLKTAENESAGTREAESAPLSPAEAMALTGADYALVLQLAAPLETRRGGTIYARQNVFYTLFSFDGKAVDSGRASKIFDAPTVDDALRELRVCEVSELAVAELEKKIATGKVVLKKPEAAEVGEAEFVALVESMAFPQVIENKDGTFSIAEKQASVTFPGIAFKIGGLSYTLAADGAPTKLKLPLGRTLFVSAKHRDIEPIERVIKLEKSGEKIVLPITLSKAARERWKKDLNEISSIVGKQKITAAEASRLRGIAKFWENSGVKISGSVTRKVVQETKTELRQIEETAESAEAKPGAE